MKRLKIGLLARIIIAITLGIGFGNVLPGELVRVFVTFNGIFSEFLGFIIPLIILGLVTPAIADIGKEAGKMLVITTLVAYSATLFSGFLSYFTGVTFFSAVLSRCAMPRPSVKAKIKEVITFITGGMATVKNGEISCASLICSIGAPGVIMEGKKVTPVK
jgi:Na+/H+-dicarboxylate symporter